MRFPRYLAAPALVGALAFGYTARAEGPSLEQTLAGQQQNTLPVQGTELYLRADIKREDGYKQLVVLNEGLNEVILSEGIAVVGSRFSGSEEDRRALVVLKLDQDFYALAVERKADSYTPLVGMYRLNQTIKDKGILSYLCSDGNLVFRFTPTAEPRESLSVPLTKKEIELYAKSGVIPTLVPLEPPKEDLLKPFGERVRQDHHDSVANYLALQRKGLLPSSDTPSVDAGFDSGEGTLELPVFLYDSVDGGSSPDAGTPDGGSVEPEAPLVQINPSDAGGVPPARHLPPVVDTSEPVAEPVHAPQPIAVVPVVHQRRVLLHGAPIYSDAVVAAFQDQATKLFHPVDAEIQSVVDACIRKKQFTPGTIDVLLRSPSSSSPAIVTIRGNGTHCANLADLLLRSHRQITLPSDYTGTWLLHYQIEKK